MRLEAAGAQSILDGVDVVSLDLDAAVHDLHLLASRAVESLAKCLWGD